MDPRAGATFGTSIQHYRFSIVEFFKVPDTDLVFFLINGVHNIL